MALKLSDLPPAARARVTDAEPAKPSRKPRRKIKGTGPAYVCGQCDERFDSVDGFDAHFDATGHAVGFAVLGPAPDVEGGGE